ncbi:MAG: hypothetical protein ACFCU5_17500 [Pleurocapsa sp.]
MLSRRQIILGLTALTGGAMAYAIGTAHQSNSRYNNAAWFKRG